LRAWLEDVHGTADERDFCQSEVQDPGMSAFGGENIRWLHVAVDYTFSVNGIKGIGNFNGQ
jgi:hypothetical protein